MWPALDPAQVRTWTYFAVLAVSIVGAGVPIYLVIRRIIFTPWSARNIRLFAERLGFSYEPQGLPGLPPFPVLKEPNYLLWTVRPEYRSILRGTWHGYKALVFDFTILGRRPYALIPRADSVLEEKTVAAFYSFEASLPSFQLDLAGSPSESPDCIPVPFPSHSELSRHYSLQGQNPEEVGKVFHHAVLEFLSAPGFDRHIAVQGCGNWLLFFEKDLSMSPTEGTTAEEMTTFLHRAGNLAEMIFGYRKYGRKAEGPATLTPWEQEKQKALEERIRMLVSMGQTMDAVTLACSEGKMPLPDAKSLVRRLSEKQ